MIYAARSFNSANSCDTRNNMSMLVVIRARPCGRGRRSRERRFLASHSGHDRADGIGKAVEAPHIRMIAQERPRDQGHPQSAAATLQTAMEPKLAIRVARRAQHVLEKSYVQSSSATLHSCSIYSHHVLCPGGARHLKGSTSWT
jgi:hypothetical protein